MCVWGGGGREVLHRAMVDFGECPSLLSWLLSIYQHMYMSPSVFVAVNKFHGYT